MSGAILYKVSWIAKDNGLIFALGIQESNQKYFL